MLSVGFMWVLSISSSQSLAESRSPFQRERGPVRRELEKASLLLYVQVCVRPSLGQGGGPGSLIMLPFSALLYGASLLA